MLLAVDSGINTGWALFDQRPNRKPLLVAASTASYIDPQLEWFERTEAVIRSLNVQVRHWRNSITRVAIEFPEFTKGEANKLCYMTGRTSGWAMSLPSMEESGLRLVGVNEWKGQLPKAVSSRRVLEVLNRIEVSTITCPQVSTHTIDAIGIGLFCIGVSIKK